MCCRSYVTFMRKISFILVLCCGLIGPGSGTSRCRATPSTTETATPNAVPVSAAEFGRLRALYAHNAGQSLDVRSVRRERRPEYSTEYLTLRGARGARVPAYIVLPRAARAARPAPGIVLLHGLGGSAEEMLPIGSYLAFMGYATVIPEIVGHGARRDAANPLFRGDAVRLREGLIESVQDVRRALDVFAARREVDERRIGLVGLSLGAILGAITTAVDARIATSVLVVGGADWRLLLAGSGSDGAHLSTASDLTVLEAVDPKTFVGHIAPRPVLMLNGRRDTVIPVDAARTLFAAAREPKKQIWFDAGHRLPPLQVIATLQKWLGRELAPGPPLASRLSP